LLISAKKRFFNLTISNNTFYCILIYLIYNNNIDSVATIASDKLYIYGYRGCLLKVKNKNNKYTCIYYFYYKYKYTTSIFKWGKNDSEKNR